MKLAALIMVGMVGGISGVAQGKSLFRDRETLEYLASKAAKFSGRVLLPVDQLPPIFVVSRDEELGQGVCGPEKGPCDNDGFRLKMI